MNPVGAADALGVFFVVFAVFAAFMLASALAKRALAAVLVVAVPRFLIAGIADLAGNQTLSQVGAVLGFLLTAVALYTAGLSCPDARYISRHRRDRIVTEAHKASVNFVDVILNSDWPE